MEEFIEELMLVLDRSDMCPKQELEINMVKNKKLREYILSYCENCDHKGCSNCWTLLMEKVLEGAFTDDSK